MRQRLLFTFYDKAITLLTTSYEREKRERLIPFEKWIVQKGRDGKGRERFKNWELRIEPPFK